MKSIKKIELRATRVKVAESCVVYHTTIVGPHAVVRVARSLLKGEDQEVFLVFLLDCRNKISGYSEIARGGIDTCPVDPRVVFRTAIVQGASGIVLAHCHPSGNVSPSSEDLALTTRLVEAGHLLGMPVLDHVIIGQGHWVSLAEKGLLEKK